MEVDIKKLVKDLDDLIESNQKVIDDDMDGDNACQHEIDAFEHVIWMIEKQTEEIK